MTDHPLRPVDRHELREALSHALRYSRAGKRTQDRADVMATAAAEHIIEALTKSGYIVVQRPPAPAHTGHVPAHGVALSK